MDINKEDILGLILDEIRPVGPYDCKLEGAPEAAEAIVKYIEKQDKEEVNNERTSN